MKPPSFKLPTLREAGAEARLLLIGIPVLIWTMVPIYHMFLFAISPKEDAFSGNCGPPIRPCTISTLYFTSSIISCGISGSSSGIRA